MNSTDRDLFRDAFEYVVVDAPEAPPFDAPLRLGWAPSPASHDRPRRPAMVAAAAFAVTILVVGLGALVLTRGSDGSEAVGSESTISSGFAAATMVPADAVDDSPAAAEWHQWARDAMVAMSWDREIRDSYESAVPLAEGGSVTAAVTDSQAELVLVVDFDAFVRGEYVDEPAWQQDAVDADDEGKPTEQGTVFVSDAAPETLSVSLVMDVGIITVRAEATPRTPLPGADQLEALAEMAAPTARRLAGDTATETRPRTEATLPSLVLDGLDGHPDIDLATLPEPTLLVLWAPWCGPCTDQLVTCQEIADDRPDLNVLGIATETTVSEAQAWIEEHQPTFPSAFDQGELRAALDGQGLPLVVLVEDADSARLIYGERTTEQLLSAIDNEP